ncbi:hypothetical protein NP83_01200 [Neobacillus niacini]|nr:hypothetical protein NP83_01200 [Neobacillus niacini]
MITRFLMRKIQFKGGAYSWIITYDYLILLPLMQSLILERRYFAWGETVNIIAQKAFLLFWLCTLFFKIKIRSEQN